MIGREKQAIWRTNQWCAQGTAELNRASIFLFMVINQDTKQTRPLAIQRIVLSPAVKCFPMSAKKLT